MSWLAAVNATGGMETEITRFFTNMDVILSDNLKRWLCRGAFCLLCALPTFLTLRTVLLPVSRAEWSARITQRLGMTANVGQVKLCTPQRTDLSNIVLGGDSFESRLEIDYVVMQNQVDAREFQIGTVKGSARALRQALDRMNRQIDAVSRSDRPLVVRARSVVLTHNDSSDSRKCELSDVSIQVERSGNQLQIQFSRSYKDSGDRRVSITRMLDTHQTTWQVDGTNEPIPGWLISEFCPGMDFIGDEAQLSGRAVLYQGESGWSGELADVVIDKLNLSKDVGSQLRLPISGQARININSATIVDNCLQEIIGSLYSHNGSIGHDLLAASQACAEMRIVEPFGTVEEVEYGELNFGFRLRHYLISIYAPEERSGAILTAIDGSKVLIANSGKQFPMVNLLNLLSWPHNQKSPVNRYTTSIASRLAWPPIPLSGVESGKFNGRVAEEQQVGMPYFR